MKEESKHFYLIATMMGLLLMSLPVFSNAVSNIHHLYANDTLAGALVAKMDRVNEELYKNPLLANDIVTNLLLNPIIDKQDFIPIKLAALELAAESAFRLGYYYSQVEYASTGYELAVQKALSDSTAQFLSLRGQAYDLLGETKKAQKDFDQSVSIAKNLNNQSLTFSTYRRRGDFHSYQGHYEMALLDLQVAHNIYVESGKQPQFADVLNNLASLYDFMGDSKRAVATYTELLAIQRKRGDQYAVSTSLYNVARIEQQQGHYDSAKDSFTQSLTISQSLNDISGIAFAKSGLGSLLLAKNEAEKSLLYFQDALLGFKILNNKEQFAQNLIYLAQSQFQLGWFTKALNNSNKALEMLQGFDFPLILRSAHQLRSKIFAKTNKFEQAYNAYVSFKSIDEEITAAERENQLSHLMIQFETESKTRENQLLQKQNELNKLKIEQSEKQASLQFGVITLFSILILVLTFSVSKLAILSKKLKRLAHTDELSSLPNRRSIIERCNQEIARCKRYNDELSVVIFDIDKFKNINDTFGHQTGDEVIRRVSNQSQSLLRKQDAMGRIGGEEFLMVLPHTPANDAIMIAERIRKRIANISYEDIDPRLQVTISLGVTTMLKQDIDINDLTHRADIALYKAKESGRNRSEFLRNDNNVSIADNVLTLAR